MLSFISNLFRKPTPYKMVYYRGIGGAGYELLVLDSSELTTAERIQANGKVRELIFRAQVASKDELYYRTEEYSDEGLGVVRKVISEGRPVYEALLVLHQHPQPVDSLMKSLRAYQSHWNLSHQDFLTNNKGVSK